MEGYLFKKARGQSTFGRKNWKKRWCVLEGQFFTYYEDFNLAQQKPVNKKGMVPVRGCTIEAVANGEKPFSFIAKHESRPPLLMAAEDERMYKIWMKALEKAASSTSDDGPANIDFTEYYEALGLDPDDEPTLAQINRAYRKAALKAHPDKGGDIAEFKRLQEALQVLTSKIEEEEQEKLYTNIEYEVEVEKGPPGVGFGMVVIENPKKGTIIIKDVLKTINIVSISDESGGRIKKDDTLIQIGDDDVSKWALPRVVQRLSDFRVPVNTSVLLRFSRRVKIDGSDDEEEQEEEAGEEEGEEAEEGEEGEEEDGEEEEGEEEDEDGEYEEGEDGEEEEDEDGDAAERKSESPPPFDIDETIVEHSFEEKHGGHDDASEAFDIDESSPPAPVVEHYEPSADAEVLPDQAKKSRGLSSIWAAVDDSSQVPSASGENNAVPQTSRNIFTSKNLSASTSAHQSEELRRSQRERDQAMAEIEELRAMLQASQSENKELFKQLELAEQDCEEAERREAEALYQLKELSLYSQQSKEDADRQTKETENIAKLIKNKKEIPVSRDFEVYLQKHGYGDNTDVKNDPNLAAIRTALRAAGATDKDGAVLQRWANDRDSVVSKLKRFEKRVLKTHKKIQAEQAAASGPRVLRGQAPAAVQSAESIPGAPSTLYVPQHLRGGMDQGMSNASRGVEDYRVSDPVLTQSSNEDDVAGEVFYAPELTADYDASSQVGGGASVNSQRSQNSSYVPQNRFQPGGAYRPASFTPASSAAPSGNAAPSPAGSSKVQGLLERKFSIRSPAPAQRTYTSAN